MAEMTSTPVQLSLGVTLRDDATFDNFFTPDPQHKLTVTALQQVAKGEESSSLVIWGAPGCGLTHLMHAVCHAAHRRGLAAQYLPLREIGGYAAEDICEGMEEAAIVCIDDIEAISGDRRWESSLFHLHNKLRDAGRSMLISAHVSPSSLPVLLADLKSRVLGGLVFQVRALSDAHKQEALVMRARARGMHMPAKVAQFILKRASRDMHDLFLLLNRLDDVSVQRQRKLTIPFVKDVLDL